MQAYQLHIWDEERSASYQQKSINFYQKIANRLQPQLVKLEERASRKCRTQKQAREADAALLQLQSVSLVTEYAKALSQRWETNSVPPSLQFLDKESFSLLCDLKKKEVNSTLDLNTYFTSIHFAKERNAFRKAHINSSSSLLKALAELDNLYSPGVTSQTHLVLHQLQRSLIGCDISGYFPTPSSIAHMIASMSDLQPSHLVLEPSAGKGDLAGAIKKQCPEVTLHCLECNYTLRQILQLQNYEVIGSDFLEYSGKYDRIIMNPPFEDGIYTTHIRHAYACLREEGKLIAIAPQNFTFRTQKKYSEFNSWLREKKAYVENLPKDAFKESDRPTGIQTCVISIAR